MIYALLLSCGGCITKTCIGGVVCLIGYAVLTILVTCNVQLRFQ